MQFGAAFGIPHWHEPFRPRLADVTRKMGEKKLANEMSQDLLNKRQQVSTKDGHVLRVRRLGTP